MVSLLVAQVNLTFQAAVFALLTVSLVLARKRKIKFHAQVMLTAVVFNLVSLMAVMAPVLHSITLGSGVSSLLAMAHGSIGASASLLSIWVVGVWLMQPLMDVPARLQCSGSLNRKLMVTVLLLWLISLILGFVLYGALYVKLP